MVARDDQLAGSFRDTQQPGDYTIEVSASRKGTFWARRGPQFTVAEQDLELDNASSDPDAMKGVAKASGGELVRAEMLPKWLDELMKKSDYLEVKQETKKDLWRKFYSLPPSVFARWPWFFDIVEWLFFSAAGLFFFAVVMLLAVEWYLRKRGDWCSAGSAENLPTSPTGYPLAGQREGCGGVSSGLAWPRAASSARWRQVMRVPLVARSPAR